MSETGWRELGCTECNKPFPEGMPFVHHESDGGIGGPWCLHCAVNKFGFGSYHPSDNFVFHPADEP